MYSKAKTTTTKLLILSLIVSVLLSAFFISGCNASKAEDFSYSVENNEVIIRGYLGSDSNVVIPDKIEGSKVTTIAEDAFYDNLIVESITIPDSVTTLEKDAIGKCENLTEITMSDTLYYTYLDEFGYFSDTIYGCPNLYINGVLMDAEYGSNKPRRLVN